MSVCTEAIITGLESGLADRDGDGWVSAHDLYDYVYSVVKQTATQTPTYFASNVEGKLLLSRVPQATQPRAPQAGTSPDQGATATTITAWKSILRDRRSVTVLTILLLAVIGLVVTLLTSVPSTGSYARATAGTPIISDSLHDNSAGNRWHEGTTQFGDCKFTQGAYHVLPAKGIGYHMCCTTNANLENLAVQVEMTIISGDEGGIAFRWNDSAGYFFHVTKEGIYKLFTYNPQTGVFVDLRRSSSPLINIGSSRSNVLAVLAQDHTIQLYVNKQLIDTAQDATFTKGMIGLCARDFSDSTDVEFRNVKVWQS